MSVSSMGIMVLSGVVLLLMGQVVVACGPDAPDEVPEDAAERYADAMCAVYQSCGCMGGDIEDVASCRRKAQDLFHEVERMAYVEFDSTCFDGFIAHIDDIGCHGLFDEDLFEPFPCMPFRGTLPRGAACEFDPYSQGEGHINPGPCADDQPCLGGRCGGPAPEVGLGERCGFELGVRCGQGRYCARDGTCHEQVGLGEACDTPRACAEGAQTYCAGIRPESDMLGECVPRVHVGAACTPDDVETCEITSNCSRGGVCGDAWPITCHALTPANDWYDAREWIPKE